VGAFAQRLLDDLPTPGALLTGEMGSNSNHRNMMHHSIGVDPLKELPPCHVADALGKAVIAYHVGNLEVFIGNQVVRRDERVRRFPSEIFTLPLDLEIALCEFLADLFAMDGLFLCSGKAAMQALQLLFRLMQEARILHYVPQARGVEVLQTHIDADLCARCHMLHLAISFDCELAIVAISAAHDTHPLDAFRGEGCDLLFLVPTRRRHPMPQPSVKVMCLPSGESFHPVVLYSTLLLSC